MKIVYKRRDLNETFGEISPFNMKRDIKYIKKKHIRIDKILEEIEAKLDGKNYDVVYQRKICNKIKDEIVLVKVKIINPQNNKGESSGFRVIGIIDECMSIAIIFNLYPKDGSERKDALTPQERAKANVLYFDYLKG